MPPVTSRLYFVSGDHLNWAPLPHPHKSTKPSALEVFMIPLDHGQHLIELIVNEHCVPSP
jgi:hypothetical protein